MLFTSTLKVVFSLLVAVFCKSEHLYHVGIPDYEVMSPLTFPPANTVPIAQSGYSSLI